MESTRTRRPTDAEGTGPTAGPVLVPDPGQNPDPAARVINGTDRYHR